MATKGTKYALACRHLTKPSLGIKQWDMKHLYDSMVVPKMFYTVNVWGAMRTTVMDVAVTHTNLMPLPFLLWKLCCQAYARMTTLLRSNPIHNGICKANWQCKHHKSLLHHLALTFPIHPKDIEEIWAPCHPPKWKPNIDVVIDGNKEDAVKCANEAKRKFRFLWMVQDIMGASEWWQFLEGLEELTRLYATTLAVKRSTQYTMVNKLVWC